MKELQIGQIVKSKAGRDQGKIFIIINIDGDYLYLVDGNIRRMEKPKKKKKKHVQPINEIIKSIQQKVLNHEKITNADIRKELLVYQSYSDES